MSKEDVEVQAQALPAYEGSNDEKAQDKVAEGSTALGGIERVQEYGYVTRGCVPPIYYEIRGYMSYTHITDTQ